MDIQINKRYYNTTKRGSNGIDKVNVKATNYYYEVSFQGCYFDYENLEELKQNILNDILKLEEKVKKIEKVKEQE